MSTLPPHIPRRISVLVADDQQIVRDGIRLNLLKMRDSLDFVIAEAATAEEAVEKVRREVFQLILMDVGLPDMGGAKATTHVVKLSPTSKVLALSVYDQLSNAEAMRAAGARGYLLKNVSPSQLLDAIKTVLSNGLYHSPEIAGKMLQAGIRVTDGKPKDLLTKREEEVWRCIVTEMTNDEIAETLSISRRTVETHRQNLMEKLNTKNTAGLIKAAVMRGIIAG